MNLYHTLRPLFRPPENFWVRLAMKTITIVTVIFMLVQIPLMIIMGEPMISYSTFSIIALVIGSMVVISTVDITLDWLESTFGFPSEPSE